ncbi:LLM class flavin-dependent oxidoreductase [Streptomyces sp. NK08204]|uniref:LLM class flavin-dependent oxidoreductase n=1 Tax=Streptomyces sp. NK08204 TaxID=2873260 RepID=UPI001CEC98CD|nr:LLM class flavin-dependent oxidoreductase [Streptomyces sp. NK08204]
MELGLISLADLTPDPATGDVAPAGRRILDIVRAAELADEAGLDVFAVGEHHHPNYAVSSPAVVLAAIAQATTRIRLTSATTLIGVLDPVRVYEDFATVDLLSGGRTEITVGRGAFPEPFELFGYELDDYDSLFTDHFELLRGLVTQPWVSWSGRHRAPLTSAGIMPRANQYPLPVWVGVGGNRGSATRAGSLGVPILAGATGGALSRFVDTFTAYRAAAEKAGHDPAELPVATTSYLHVANTSAEVDGFYAHWAAYAAHHSRGRLQGQREVFDRQRGEDGTLLLGSPQQIVDRIGRQHELFGHDRLLAQIDLGAMPFARVAAIIEILGAEVLPEVRKFTR